MTPLLAACWVFDEVMDQFDNLNIYGTCDWYKFPMKVRRLIPIIIANTDESKKKEIYLGFTLSCHTAKEVIDLMNVELNEIEFVQF